MIKALTSCIAAASVLVALGTISCIDPEGSYGPNDDGDVRGHDVEVYVGEEATKQAMKDIGGLLGDSRMLEMSARMLGQSVEERREALQAIMVYLQRDRGDLGAQASASGTCGGNSDPTIT